MTAAPASPSSSPASTTSVALVGYGYWGANLARNLAGAASTDLVAIADPSEAQRDLVRRHHPGVSTYASLEEVLAEASIDAVVLATPAAMHAEQATQALEAGKHVLVEKPLALRSEDADAVVALAADRGLTVMVGHTFLFSAPVRRLRELVSSGELGRIQYMYSQRLSLGRIRRDCSALWNFAPHDVSILLFVLDELPVEVSATRMAFIEQDNHDVYFATLRFPSGVAANVHVSWIDPRKVRLLTVVGDRKMVVFDDVATDRKLEVHDAGIAMSDDPSLGTYASMGEFQWRTRAGDVLIPKVAMTEPLLAEMDAFGTACLTGEPPVANGRHGADVVRILEAIDASAAAGGTPVTLDWKPT